MLGVRLSDSDNRNTLHTIS